MSGVRGRASGPWIVKVRKVGHSLVVTIPKELEADGYVPGRKAILHRLGVIDGEPGRIAVILLPDRGSV